MHITTKKAIKRLNKALNEGRKRPTYILLKYFLLDGINIEVAVKKFGNQHAKQFISNEETKNFIKKFKDEILYKQKDLFLDERL